MNKWKRWNIGPGRNREARIESNLRYYCSSQSPLKRQEEVSFADSSCLERVVFFVSKVLFALPN